MPSGAGTPRLLLVSRKWPPAVGGMETYSVELAESLRAHFDVELLVLPGRADGRPPPLWRVAAFLLRAMATALLRGRRYAHVVLADLVLFPMALCLRLVAPRQRRWVVVYGLDLVFQTRRGLLPRCYALYLGAFRRCQGAFAGIVAISRHTADLATRLGLRNVQVIHPSLPANALTAAAAADAPLPDAWTRATRRVLYFGRLVPRKGALWFAEQVMPNLDPDVEFFVVGHATDAASGRRLQDCARTHCLGRIDSPRLAAMIRAADVVVMPNIATPDALDVEGFGLAAIEATALGARLLAARIDGLVDAVVDGETGTLLPAGDAERWTAATVQALAQPHSTAAAVAAATRTRFARARQGEAFAGLLQPGSAG